jgi:SAM-dependent methyltransferase
VTAWHGEGKRQPDRGLYNWSLREPLARWLEEEGRGAAGLRVLDVGCGDKPYLPFFSSASEFIGIDIGDNPQADLQGSVEQLPVDDAGFDVVLCVQVLEHVEDPVRAIHELHRVVKPGGRVLAATHGTYPYHPSPDDYWRWTHAGLERLFNENADWRSVSVTPGAGTAACLGLLLGHYVDLFAQRLHAVWAGAIAIRAINRVSASLDHRSPSLREPIPGSLTTNFHVVAVR